MPTNLINKLEMLTCIDEVSRQELIEKAEQRFMSSGQQIFQEHDVADDMYIIISGKVSIYITDEKQQAIELGVLTQNRYFGEQSILTGSSGRRNASARTLEDTVLMAVSKSLFQSVINKNPDIVSRLKSLGENQLRHRLMQESELFRSIYLGIPIQRSLSEASFSRGASIYEPGNKANWFYLVLWGVVELIDSERSTSQMINPGEFFGESELINKISRQQTAFAKTELLTLKIEGEKFLELFNENPFFSQLILKKSTGLKPSLVPETA